MLTLLQVNKSKMRHRRLRELQAPGPVQWMGLLSERLCVGYPSGFMRYRYFTSLPLRSPSAYTSLTLCS